MEVDDVAAVHRPDACPPIGDPGADPGREEVALAAVAVAIDQLLAVDLTVPTTGAVLHLLQGVETQTRRLYGMSVAAIGQMDHRGLAAPAGHTVGAETTPR